MVPHYYEICAAHAAGETYYGTWQLLSPQEKATLVAHWYMNLEIDSHIEDAKAKEIKNRSKKKR